MPGEVAGTDDPRVHNRGFRTSDRLRGAGKRLSPSHGAQPGRHAGVRRQGQASARVGDGAAALEGPEQVGADLRAARLVSGEGRLRKPLGTSRVRTRIKICGITRPADGLAAASAGADAIGLVFYPPSPRYLSLERACEIRDALPPFVQSVALFVNA